MTNVNKRLTELRGECWHEWIPAFPHEDIIDYSMRGHRCKKCGEYWPTKIEDGYGSPNYFTPAGFFILWNWAKSDFGGRIEGKTFNKFMCYLQFSKSFGNRWDTFWKFTEHWAMPCDAVDPATFPARLLEYLEEK